MLESREFHPTRSRYLVITFDYLFPLILILFSILTWWIVFYTKLFAITRLDCQLDFEPCKSPHVITELNRYLGVNLLRFDPTQIKTRLTSADFTIREVSVKKILPGTLQVSLQSVYPTVAARIEDQSSWVIFDDKLRVIGQKQIDPNVSTLIVSELKGIIIGETPKDAELISALNLTRRLGSEFKGISSVKLSGTDITLSLAEGKRALMTTEKDETVQIKSLQSVLRDVTILGEANTIDVRFSQPVLR